MASSSQLPSPPTPAITTTTIDDVPREILERIFALLPVEGKLSAGFTCRRWMDILKGYFVHLTDVSLCFEDDQCKFDTVIRGVQECPNLDQFSGGDGNRKRRRASSTDHLQQDKCCSSVTVNLCACPGCLFSHRHALRIIMIAAGRYFKKLIVEDYLLGKGCFVDSGLLEMFAKRCPSLSAIELHHVDLSRTAERDLAEIFPPASSSSRLSELYFDQCVWTSWSELSMNRVLKSIVLRTHSSLRELHLTSCALLNDRTLRFVAKTCPLLWYADLSGCKSITADGLAYFFYYMPQRQSDMLYVKIHKTRIDGNELQYFLYCCDQQRACGGLSSSTTAQNKNYNASNWAVCNFMMDTGHRACSFQNRFVPGKSIVVFV